MALVVPTAGGNNVDRSIPRVRSPSCSTWNRSASPSAWRLPTSASRAGPFSTAKSDAPFRTFWKRDGTSALAQNNRARSRAPARNARIQAVFARFQRVHIRRATCERLLHFSRAVTRAQATTASSPVHRGSPRCPRRRVAQARMEFIPSMSLFTVYDDNVFARVDGSAGQMLQLRPEPRRQLRESHGRGCWASTPSTCSARTSRRSTRSTRGATRSVETRFRTTPFTTLAMAMRYDRSETPGEIDFDSGILGERRQARAAGDQSDLRAPLQHADVDDRRLRLDDREPDRRRARHAAHRPRDAVARGHRRARRSAPGTSAVTSSITSPTTPRRAWSSDGTASWRPAPASACSPARR